MGPRSGHTKITSGDGSQMVDEIIFVGMQSLYYTYANTAQRENITNYMNDQALAMTAWVEVVQGNAVVATGSRRLAVAGAHSVPTLRVGIQNLNNGTVRLTVTGAPDRTAILQGSATVGNGSSWSTVATVNDGDVILRTAPGMNYYRALLQ